MILVAGATGTLGSRLVRRLLARKLPVRVLTRDPTRAAKLAALGAEVVRGDLRDEQSVRRAAHGVSTIVAAAHGFAGTNGSSTETVDRQGNRLLVDAAAAAGADFILVSVVGASPSSPMELFRAKYEAEEYVQRSGVRATIVRATAFAETWIGILGEPLRQRGRGLVFGRGQNPINFVSADAVAALVERAVVDVSLRSQTVEIGGPSNLTLSEFVALLAMSHGVSREAQHVPRPILRAMSVFLRPVKPSFAAQTGAAVVMDTLDMTFDAAPLRTRFPDLPNVDVRHLLATAVAP
ncbi:MAG: SDR family oxidoreductase [Gemmatimonadota bacterium]|nr:SDR family oxidoreductase [Gemmatimonadota bacterium]